VVLRQRPTGRETVLAVPDATALPPLPPPAPPTPPPVAPARTVHLTITSRPAGARVVDLADGQVRGVTPIELTVPASDQPLALRLEKEGYRPSRLAVPRQGDRTVSGELAPRPPPPHPRHPKDPKQPKTVRPEIEEPAKL
jgi:hypothetical protein